MVNINHRIGIKASLADVYEALSTTSGISGWWTKDTSGESATGKTIIVRFHTTEGTEIGSMDIAVTELIPEKKVQWKIKAGPPEWIGTDVIFNLKQEGDYTIVLFSHINWAEEAEFKAHCSMKWAIFLLSLKHLIEKGKGEPSPNDIKIDNWN
jgi:uncharacterized protein YndB with AHSA1/START domain